jgi:solute carrier family 35 (UDP-galactose transporter), member B1
LAREAPFRGPARSFPFQVLAKSCKPIPVMLGQIVFGGKKHPWWRYVFVGTLALAVAGFEFLKPSKHGHGHAAKAAVGDDDDDGALWASLYGYLLLTVSLLCDSFTGPTQDKILPSMGIDGVQLMAWQNLWATLFAGIALAIRGSAADTVAFFYRHPDLFDDFLLFLVTSATGQFFIFGTLALYDSLFLTTVTTVRKFVTILLSVIRFGHEQTFGQWLMVLLVFSSILGDKLVTVWTDHGKHHHHHHAHPAPKGEGEQVDKHRAGEKGEGGEKESGKEQVVGGGGGQQDAASNAASEASLRKRRGKKE